MRKVGAAAGEEIVDRDHAPAFGEKGVAEMGSQKSCAAGDHCASLSHAFLPFLRRRQGTSFGMSGRAAHTVVGEALGGHDLGIIQVASVDHDGILEFLAQAAEIEIGEFLPLGENQQSVGAVGGFVGGVGEGTPEGMTSWARSMAAGS